MKQIFISRATEKQVSSDCCPGTEQTCDCAPQPRPLGVPVADGAGDDAPCCGHRQGPPSSPHERPGYRISHFVEGFLETAEGPVPRIRTRLQVGDLAGTFRARLGISRDRYRVSPGLYCVGNPDAGSPVLVTANYKLSFDTLRRELTGLDGWLLVLDTRGVNVWCSAGKRTFSTEEVVRKVRNVNLHELVSHRELILPQLAAPGVAAHRVLKDCGFKVVWGPVRAGDLQTFLYKDCKAEEHMRQLTFSLRERIVLIPVELSLIVKPSLAILVAVFILSGIGPDIFSFSSAWFRGLNGAMAYLLGVLAGAVAVPAFLPWLPIRRFYLKGILTGLAVIIPVILYLGNSITRLESLTLVLLTMAVSSYAAMNFTGATPYTSPSGVEKEMRQGIPLQALSVIIAVVAWIAAPFMG